MGKKRTIILRLDGGMGNQLFQYAFARTIQNKYGGRIIFDLGAFSKRYEFSLKRFVLNDNVDYKNRSRLTLLSLIIIRKSARLIQLLIKTIIINRVRRTKLLSFLGIFIQEDTRYYYHLYSTISPILFISGNWMSEKYFSSTKEILINEFRMNSEPSQINRTLIEKLKNCNSVAVHIRRGDYTNIEWADKLLVCDFSYFEKAMQKMNVELDNPVFYIFSNSREDINWIKTNYKFSSRTVNYIDLNNTGAEDFRLMVNCKHFILSNSTFCWWASYLSEFGEKVVIAPRKWNNDVWDVSDIYLPNWQIV